MEQPTRRQREALTAIEGFIETHGYSPTVRELCEMMDIVSPSSGHAHLTALAKAGLIEWNPKAARTIRLIQTPRVQV